MTEIEKKAQEIVDGLTVKQAMMLTRPEGRYADDTADVLHLINIEVWGTCFTPLGLQIRAALQETGQ